MIIYRKLSKQEITVLANEVKSTPNIIGLTRKEWTDLGKVFVSEVSGELAGVCADKDLGFGWSEIADLVVLEKSRGLGLGRELFNTVFKHAKASHKHIYAVSRNPLVVAMMRKSGFEFVKSFLFLPHPVQYNNIKLIFNFYHIKEYLRKYFKYRYFNNVSPYNYGIYLNR